MSIKKAKSGGPNAANAKRMLGIRWGGRDKPQQGKSTPVSFPYFVVYRGLERKGRHFATHVYPLPLQPGMFFRASFFYQWRVHRSDKHKLTHRGQETLNVAVMGYQNSSAYVQRQIDRILRAYRAFTKKPICSKFSKTKLITKQNNYQQIWFHNLDLDVQRYSEF